jgi:hypothetical protein
MTIIVGFILDNHVTYTALYSLPVHGVEVSVEFQQRLED